ncbi:threonylcarbamoyl-AMP synthase [Gammaproteobacteria bacterium]
MNQFLIREAARMVRQGGVVAYPTEGVYGLGCDPDNPLAVERLLRLKGRSVAKGLILLASDWSDLAPFVSSLSSSEQERILDSWPGAMTWLVPASSRSPVWLTGGGNRVAVRVTAHPVAAALCRALGGGLVSTSANRSGQPPARSALAVRRRFLEGGLDVILHGALGNLSRPTPIRDALTGVWLRR